jgi:hypothetical protein
VIGSTLVYFTCSSAKLDSIDAPQAKRRRQSDLGGKVGQLMRPSDCNDARILRSMASKS